MALYPMYFQPLSFQQANPFGAGLMQGTQIAGMNAENIGRNLQNALLGAQVPYAGQMAQQALQARQLANALSQNTLNYAPQMSQAELALRNAQANAQNALPGLYGAEASEAGARAGLTNQQASLLRQQMPFLVQQEQEKLFSDPVLSRLNQINLAQKSGMIPSNLLSTIGYGNQTPSATGAPSALTNNPNLTPATAPKAFTGDAATNFALFGSPYNPIDFSALQKRAETQAATGVTTYNSALQNAAQDADIANQTINLLNQFRSGYDNSTYKGSRSGWIPSSGRMAALVPGNLSPEQAADNASQNIAATVAKLVAGGRVTNYEMQYINNLKPNRNMDDATEQMATNYLTAKMTRLKEMQSFLNAAKNANVDPQTANTLWQMYETQRPVYDFANNKVNKSFQGDWRSFLTPQAVQAAQNGQSYVNIPTFKNQASAQAWLRTQPQDIRNAVAAQLQGGQ